METNVNGLQDREDAGIQMEGNPLEGNLVNTEASGNETNEARPKHKHHEDHHVNRKYRVFSNHSSYGDSPHTNTSF